MTVAIAIYDCSIDLHLLCGVMALDKQAARILDQMDIAIAENGIHHGDAPRIRLSSSEETSSRSYWQYRSDMFLVVQLYLYYLGIEISCLRWL